MAWCLVVIAKLEEEAEEEEARRRCFSMDAFVRACRSHWVYAIDDASYDVGTT